MTTTFTILTAKPAYYVIPELTTLRYALKVTAPYVNKLRKLRDIAPEEDRDFFDFVVAQEVLQVDMLELRVAGKVQESADLLRDFISAHQETTAEL